MWKIPPVCYPPATRTGRVGNKTGCLLASPSVCQCLPKTAAGQGKTRSVQDNCRQASAGVTPARGGVEPRHMDIAVGEIAQDLGAAALERNVHEIKTRAL